MIRPILLLGDPALYQVSSRVQHEEASLLEALETDLHDTMMEYRRVHGAGRAIAAPQIGVFKRVLYMQVDEPILIVNPSLSFPSTEKMQIWDDCMCFPDLLVKVVRYQDCQLNYFDRQMKVQRLNLTGSLSELIQHEYDHLEGILATMRAVDTRSFKLKGTA